MVTDSHETDNRNYLPTATVAELSAAVDALEARVDEGERRIAEALTPEPMDWDRHYTEILASVAATAARFDQDGGAT